MVLMPDTTMLALFTLRRTKDAYGYECDLLESAYTRYFERLGIRLLTVPNDLDPRPYLDCIEGVGGIILSGGNDVCPRAYGEASLGSSDCSMVRDSVEQTLLEVALQKKIPVLALCRGMQFVNVYFDGRLVQDISQQLQVEHLPGERHAVTITQGQGVDFLGCLELEVNSFHNQAVTTSTLADGLVGFAQASGTEIIEGLYHPGYPLAGVQFHPERDSKPNPTIDRLIAAFKGRELFWEVD